LEPDTRVAVLRAMRLWVLVTYNGHR
jgi:hypothetical protein